MNPTPNAYENFALPYSLLPSNNFVNLVCSIFKNEIKQGAFKDIFDDVSNIDGTNDKGRDIVLYREKKPYGVIQCKRYKDNITKSDIENEVLKFALYYIKDETLIHDTNDFTYFYIAPKFSDTTVSYIHNFNENISKDVNLPRKVETVISNNKRDLKGLEFEEIKEKLINLLSSIKIKRICQDDLGDYLSKDYNKYIVGKYFGVKKLILAEPEIDLEVVKIDFENASNDFLKNQRYEFGNLPSSQIERTETNKLFEWVASPVKENEPPIAVLIGKAGYGKSVILRQLTQKLQDENIPTLAIKADRNFATTTDDLDKRLILKYGIAASIRELALEYDRVVILFDQIDALSQTQSLKNDYAITFSRLVNLIKKQKNIRIVTSVREYDLATETEFMDLIQANKFQVELLTESDVKSVLAKLKIQSPLPKRLLELLRTPNHLDIFCQIHHPKRNYDTITTLQDLHNKLWNAKILKSRRASLSNVKELLYRIAKEIYDRGLSIPLSVFQDDYSQELEYLSSEGLITQNDEKIQFFHQTFYEYVYAKRFAEQKENLLEYIQENHYGFEVRASIKMILSFLRDSNPKYHIQCLEHIIASEAVAFHIKFLVITLVGYLDDPTSKEKEFVTAKILSEEDYRDIFLENAYGNSWLNYLIDKKILNGLIFNTQDKAKINRWRIILMNNLAYAPDCVFNYLESIKFDFLDKALVYSDLLYRNKKWDNSIPQKLFDIYYIKPEILDDHNDTLFYHILENATDDAIDWVVTKFQGEVIKSINQNSTEHFGKKINLSFSQNELLTMLFEKAPQKALLFCMELLELVLSQTQYVIEQTQLLNDYSEGILQDDELDPDLPDTDHKSFFKTLIENVRQLAKIDSIVFQEFNQQYKRTRFVRIQRISLNGYIQNPDAYKEDIFDFILHFSQLGGFCVSETTVRELLEKAITKGFPLFSRHQKVKTSEIIQNIKVKYEQDCYKRWLQNKEEHSNWKKENGCFIGKRRYKFLCAIPLPELEAFPILKKELLEFKRKFGEYKTPVKRRGIISGVYPPLANRAYEKMNNEQWLASFRDISADMDVFSLKGGINEHSRAFREQVKIRPTEFIDLIQVIVENEEISDTYVIDALEGLKDAKYSPLYLMNLWVKAKNRKQNGCNPKYLIWLTDYFITSKITNEEVFNYLVESALRDEHEKELEIDDAHLIGFNTTQGAALNRLIRCSYEPNYKNTIFDTLFTVINDCSMSVKCVIVQNLQYLIHLDSTKVRQLFLVLTQSPNANIYQNAVNVAYWLAREDFKAIEQFYINSLQFPADEKYLPEIATTIFYLWLIGKDECYDLLMSYFEKSDKCKSRILSEAGKHLFENQGEFFSKCSIILNTFLECTNPQIVKKFERVFKKEKADFENLLPFMKKYTKSKAIKVEFPAGFYMFLLDFTKEYPQQCLDLLESFDKNHGKGSHYGKFLFNIILSSYGSISGSDKDYKRKAITIFDKALSDDIYRLQAVRILNETDE